MTIKTTPATLAPLPSISLANAKHGRMYRSANGSRVLALKGNYGMKFVNLGSDEAQSGSAYHDVGYIFTGLSGPLVELPKGTEFTVVQD